MFGDEWNMEIQKGKGEFFRQESEFFQRGCEVSPSFGEFHGRDRWDNPAISPNRRNRKLLRSYFFIAAAVVLVLYSTSPLYGGGWLAWGDEWAAWQAMAERNSRQEYYIERVPYVVRAGDTLWDIAKRYMGDAMGYHAIVEENNLENPDLIFPGDRLILPVPHEIGEE